jgi:site-specific recombinase XerD
MNNYINKLKFELELRTYSPSTIKHYICQVKLLEKHYNKSCDLITSDEIKEYHHFRISSGISYSNIDISCNAFKIMFNTVLNRNWSDNVIVRPKKQQKLPCVLSKEEILIFLFNHAIYRKYFKLQEIKHVSLNQQQFTLLGILSPHIFLKWEQTLELFNSF